MSPTTTDLRTMLDQATPGLWEADIDHERNLGTVNVIPDDTHYGVTTAANARLIAAAPEMAAEVLALRKMREDFADLAADLGQIGLEYRTGAYGQVDLLAAKLYEEVETRLRTLLGDQS